MNYWANSEKDVSTNLQFTDFLKQDGLFCIESLNFYNFKNINKTMYLTVAVCLHILLTQKMYFSYRMKIKHQTIDLFETLID